MIWTAEFISRLRAVNFSSMGNRQNDALIPSGFEYDAPVPDEQAQCRIALQSLDLAANCKRVGRELVQRPLDPAPDDRVQRVELPRGLGREYDGPSPARGLADALLVLDQREAHKVVAVLAEADARRDGDVGLLDQQF